MKRNLHIMKQIESYDKEYQNIKLRKFNSEQILNKTKRKTSDSLLEITLWKS